MCSIQTTFCLSFFSIFALFAETSICRGIEFAPLHYLVPAVLYWLYCTSCTVTAVLYQLWNAKMRIPYGPLHNSHHMLYILRVHTTFLYTCSQNALAMQCLFCCAVTRGGGYCGRQMLCNCFAVTCCKWFHPDEVITWAKQYFTCTSKILFCAVKDELGLCRNIICEQSVVERSAVLLQCLQRVASGGATPLGTSLRPWISCNLYFRGGKICIIASGGGFF